MRHSAFTLLHLRSDLSNPWFNRNPGVGMATKNAKELKAKPRGWRRNAFQVHPTGEADVPRRRLPWRSLQNVQFFPSREDSPDRGRSPSAAAALVCRRPKLPRALVGSSPPRNGTVRGPSALSLRLARLRRYHQSKRPVRSCNLRRITGHRTQPAPVGARAPVPVPGIEVEHASGKSRPTPTTQQPD